MPIGEVKAAVAKMNLDLLLEHDQVGKTCLQVSGRRIGSLRKTFYLTFLIPCPCPQLVAQRRHGAAFRNFIEPPIDFPPTYKFDPGTDTFDTRRVQFRILRLWIHGPVINFRGL